MINFSESIIRRKIITLHLCALLGTFLFLFGNSLLPYLYWKSSSRREDENFTLHAKNIIRFQLTASILIYAGMFVFWYRKVIELSTREATDADFMPMAYFLIIILGVNIVYPFMNALLIKLRKNVDTLYYPPFVV